MEPVTRRQTPSPTSAFCPGCWSPLPGDARRCARCGAGIEALSERPYAVKILTALGHPIGDVRERAARLLGEVGGPDTREILLQVADDGRDPYRARCALHGLARLIERFPDLPPVDWARFTRAERPISVRIAAVEILDRRVSQGSAILRRVRG